MTSPLKFWKIYRIAIMMSNGKKLGKRLKRGRIIRTIMFDRAKIGQIYATGNSTYLAT